MSQRFPLLGAAIYLAASTAVIYGVIDRFNDVILPGLILIGSMSVLYGYLAGRWWSVFLPILFIPIAARAGYPPSEFSEPGPVWFPVLIFAPILCLLIGLGRLGRSRRLLVVWLTVLLVVFAGWVLVVQRSSGSDDEISDARFRTIDEFGGIYGGAGLGWSREEVVAALGSVRPVRDGDAAIPRDVAEAGISLDSPRLEARGGAHCYYDACFRFTDDSRVQSIELASPAAKTRRGIAVDDPLDTAEAAYPELVCTVGKDAEFGLYRYCTGQVAPDRWIWFGGDPVNVIVVASHPLEDAGAR